MNKKKFDSLIKEAEEKVHENPEYYSGYIDGLRRRAVGTRFNDPQTHINLMSKSNKTLKSMGYKEGYDAMKKSLPSPEDLKRFLKENKIPGTSTDHITGEQAADLLGLSGQNRIRAYTSEKNSTKIGYSQWFMLNARLVLKESEFNAVLEAMEENIGKDQYEYGILKSS